MVNAGVPGEPSAGLGTVMTGQVGGLHREVPLGIGRFHILQEGDIALGVA